MSKVIATKKVLVIGNGGAGSQLAAQLAKQHQKYSVSVVTPFDYSEVSLCMTKAIAMGSEEHSKIIYPLLREDKVEYFIDSCVSLTNTTATLASGKKINFDVCVIACGQKIPLFYPSLTDTTKEMRLQSVGRVSNQIKSASQIVISGGGAVASELAADIKLRNKDKK
jgi:NADH dehydrogenase FAD-containing subunit